MFRWSHKIAHCIYKVFLKAVTALVISLASMTHLLASDSEALEAVDFMEMSLEELMKIKVVSASKRPELVAEAPSVIQLLDKKTIQSYGGQTLWEVLERATSIQVVGSNLYPQNRVTLRGVMQTHVDNNILFLLNGRPIRDALQGGKNLDLYFGFPVSAIESIEIIRGPGSVIYGTNAFSGVINVKTLSHQNREELLGLSIGSYGHQQISALGGVRSESGSEGSSVGRVEDYNVDIAVNLVKQDGDQFENVSDENGVFDTFSTGGESTQLLVSGFNRSMDFNLLLSETDKDHYNSIFSYPQNQYDVSRQFLDVGYQLDHNETWQSNINLSYHRHKDEFFIIGSTIGGADSTNYLLQATSLKQIDEFNLLFGADYEIRQSKLNRSGSFFEHKHQAIYSQVDYKPSSDFKLIAGLQANKPELNDWRYSPRAGMIYKLNTRSDIKLLYGEAFRSPFILDLFVDSPALQGNKNLKPELIQTLDLEYFQQSSTNSLSLVLFMSKQKEIHARENIGGFTNTFVNRGEVDYVGAELTYQQQLSNSLMLYSSATHQQNENDQGMESITYVANEMAKLGLNYTPSKFLSTGLFVKYFGEPTQLEEVNTATAATNPTPEAFLDISFKLSYRYLLNQSDNGLDEINFSISATNLLDEESYFPSFNRQDVNSLPHYNGRSVYISVEFEF